MRRRRLRWNGVGDPFLSLFNCIINSNSNVNPWSGVHPHVIDINKHPHNPDWLLLLSLFFLLCWYTDWNSSSRIMTITISPRFTLPVLLIFSLQTACLLSLSLSDSRPRSTPVSFNFLIPRFYALSCPRAEQIIGSVVQKAVMKEAWMAASLLRLHFHDCFVKVIVYFCNGDWFHW